MNKKKSLQIIPSERIIQRIFWLRGKKVMFDSDLAELYAVPTGRLNEQVKRNKKRFPADFMFQLTSEETKIFLHSKSRDVILNEGNLQPMRSQFAIALKRLVLQKEKKFQNNYSDWHCIT